MENRHLFRGKRIDTGEWMEGYYMPRPMNPVVVKHYIVTFGQCKWIEVEPSTICQCTGLEDKNGRLIFEDDIMGGHIDEDCPEDVSRFKVEWNCNGWVINQPGCADREYISDFETENYEVVGNIFDNSELLEGNHDGE